MSSAPVKRFASAVERLYRKLARKGQTTTSTTYTTASPVLVSPQPALKAVKTEPIFFVDCTAPLPSIDSLLSLLEPAEQEAPLSIDAASPTSSPSPSLEQTTEGDAMFTTIDINEEQESTDSGIKMVEQGSGEEEEGSEALFSSSDEGSSDTSSIITITTTTTPSAPPSPRFNPTFERSPSSAEIDRPAFFPSNSDSHLSSSPSAHDIPTWISLPHHQVAPLQPFLRTFLLPFCPRRARCTSRVLLFRRFGRLPPPLRLAYTFISYNSPPRAHRHPPPFHLGHLGTLPLLHPLG